MKILLLCHTFNSLSQRLYVELSADGHTVSVELDVNDRVTDEAVDLFQPDLVLASFLKRAIAETVYGRVRTLIVHPGIRGDRGPSALDHALLRNEENWGVTVLEASPVFDAGDVWAWEEFPMRVARKSSIYRNEVTEGAVRAVRRAVNALGDASFRPQPCDENHRDFRGRHHPLCKQEDRSIDWQTDSIHTIVRKIHSGDGFPGTLDAVLGEPFYLYNAFADPSMKGAPGTILAQNDDAICIGAVNGGVWVTHLRSKECNLKLPAACVVPHLLESVPDLALDPFTPSDSFRQIRCEMNSLSGVNGEAVPIALLYFDFYNGAMSTDQCRRLQQAVKAVKDRGARLLVLFGSPDFWSNGIHLGTIEAAESPADESLRNIEAMNDLCREVITADSCLTIAAMQGNAGAGGVFFALAADSVFARSGVVLNPHYRSMGNLYGSEYWTYVLPRRIEASAGEAIMQRRLPLSAIEAARRGLIDDVFGDSPREFREEVLRRAASLVAAPDFDHRVAAKRALREAEERRRPLQDYRDAEIEHMKMNFYGFDPSYHIARYNFVYRVPIARTPLYLAAHRRDDMSVGQLPFV